ELVLRIILGFLGLGDLLVNLGLGVGQRLNGFLLLVAGRVRLIVLQGQARVLHLVLGLLHLLGRDGGEVFQIFARGVGLVDELGLLLVGVGVLGLVVFGGLGVVGNLLLVFDRFVDFVRRLPETRLIILQHGDKPSDFLQRVAAGAFELGGI